MRGSQPWRTSRSRVLRAQPIAAEAKLWAKLRNRQLGGLKFVRQAAVGPYFVDFLCRERKVIIEVDGGTHSTDREIVADGARDVALRLLGFRVLRVSNIAVYEDVASVLDGVLDFFERES
jgi:very-short-patch-repair endonuclease